MHVWFAACALPMSGCRKLAPNKGLAQRGAKRQLVGIGIREILCHERELGVIDIPSDC